MKITWILGAGASKEANYPLVRDFLSHDYISSWDKILKATFGERAEHISNDLHNTITHLQKFGKDINEVMFNSLNSNDMNTYEEAVFHMHKIFQLIQVYYTDHYSMQYLSFFADILYSTDSTVVSLNYDQLVEEKLCLSYTGLLENEAWVLAEKENCTSEELFFKTKDRIYLSLLTENRQVYDYGAFSNVLQSDYTDEYAVDSNTGYIYENIRGDGLVKILKPHGSISWYKCSQCNTIINIPRILVAAVKNAFYQGLLPTHKISSFCPTCKKETEMMNVIIPPTRGERLPFADDLQKIWDNVESELQSSDVIIVAGYSFPKEDKEFRTLVNNLKSEKNCKTIYIDPVINETRKEELRELIGETYFFEKTFSEFLSHAIVLAACAPSDGNYLPIDRLIKDILQDKKLSALPTTNHVCLSDDLVYKLRTDVDIYTRRLSIEMLGYSRNDSVFDFLKNFFSTHEISDLRASFVKTLEHFPTKESIAILCMFLFDTNVISRAPTSLHIATSPVSSFAHVVLNNLVKKIMSLITQKSFMCCCI